MSYDNIDGGALQCFDNLCGRKVRFGAKQQRCGPRKLGSSC